MCSYLTQDIELRVVQHYVGADSQTVVREHCDCLEAGAKLPSYVLEDAEMTELCVRARGDEDWSQDVQLERRNKGGGGGGGSSCIVQVQQQEAGFVLTLYSYSQQASHLFSTSFPPFQETFDKDKHTFVGDRTTKCGRSDPLLFSWVAAVAASTLLLAVGEQIEIPPADYSAVRRPSKTSNPTMLRAKIQFILSHNKADHGQETPADTWAQGEKL